jgi:hypothetical protein
MRFSSAMSGRRHPDRADRRTFRALRPHVEQLFV